MSALLILFLLILLLQLLRDITCYMSSSNSEVGHVSVDIDLGLHVLLSQLRAVCIGAGLCVVFCTFLAQLAELIHCVSEKTSRFYFCHNLVKCRPILPISGRNIPPGI